MNLKLELPSFEGHQHIQKNLIKVSFLCNRQWLSETARLLICEETIEAQFLYFFLRNERRKKESTMRKKKYPAKHVRCSGKNYQKDNKLTIVLILVW